MSKLKIKNLCASWCGKQVLNGIDLETEVGEVVVVIGPWGCGKSLLLRSIDMLTESVGEIELDGVPYSYPKDGDLLRRQIGAVLDDTVLFENMTVLDNLTLASMVVNKLKKDDAEKKAFELLKQFGLSDTEGLMSYQLSDGQLIRVLIARALMMDPKVLLLDDPTAALDPSSFGEVIATLRVIAKSGVTTIIATHEVSVAREIGDRVVYIDEGIVYEQGAPSEILDSPKLEKTIKFTKKMKSFIFNVLQRSYDLVELHGGMRSFSMRYGVDAKKARRIELIAEEIINEMIAANKEHAVEIDVEIEYSELDGSVSLKFVDNAPLFDPFISDSDSIGITIVKNYSLGYSHEYKDEKNVVNIKM